MKLTLQLIYLLCFITVQLYAQDDAPKSAPAIKTFSLQADNTGVASSTVNLFTGDVALPLSLISLPSNNGLDVNVSIAYSSNVGSKVNTWNLEAPAGILGLGWSMDYPKIIADHKQTGTREDDEYYLIEGGTSNRLIRTSQGSDSNGGYYTYETKNYQFWKINYFYDLSEVNGSGSGTNKWVIVKEDGTAYIYGDNTSERNTVQYGVRWSNWIGNSSQTTGQSRVAIVWNLSEVINLWNKRLTFAYTNVEQPVGGTSGQNHTEASYLSSVVDSYGRSLVFYYNYLDPQYYTEPNTEQVEPDAYQERYEKKYLDHITAKDPIAQNVLTVNFRYAAINTGTNKSKMLLSYVYQENSAGQILPGIKFDYNTQGTTSGLLSSVTYPTGSIVSYSYTPSPISRSNLSTTIQAPPADAQNPLGYAEPQVYFGVDYVVVAWRGLGTGTQLHNRGPEDVKIYVYQWLGEWKGQFIQSISGVSLADTQTSDDVLAYYPYKDFQVTLQDRFFAILTHGTDNNYPFSIWMKDESKRGNWLTRNQFTADYGTGLPTLLSGKDFVTIGSFRCESGNPTVPTYIFTFTGNDFKTDALYQTTGDHFYTTSNNYFISHNRDAADGTGAAINFNYMSEDKKWKVYKWPTSFTFSSSDKSYWYGSNSFVVAIASGNPEFIYRWGLKYDNLVKDNVLNTWPDNSFVFNINNTMVGIVNPLKSPTDALVARFDGSAWNVATTISTYYKDAISFGDDNAVWTVDRRNRPVNAYFRLFSPNTRTWTDTDLTFTPPDGNWNNPILCGINYFIFNNGIYIKKPDGKWYSNGSLSLPANSNIEAKSVTAGSADYFIYSTVLNQTVNSKAIQFVKNGVLSSSYPITANYAYYDRFSLRTVSLVDGNKLVTYTTDLIKDAKSLTLTYLLKEQMTGPITDYPVTLITVNDGTSLRYTSLKYNLTTATLDPSGTSAFFNEVDLIPGSNSKELIPYGYTKTFFHNGLTHADDATIVPETSQTQWLGSPYEVRHYTADNTYSSKATNSYITVSKSIFNDLSKKVDVGYYTRVTQATSKTDGGAESFVKNFHDASNGLLKISKSGYLASSDTVKTSFRYYSEVYDVNNTRNILTPVIQTKREVNGKVTDVMVSRWKDWPSANPTPSVGPFDAYQWRGADTSLADFSDWVFTTTPSADWFYQGKVSVRDASSGAPVEIAGTANKITSRIYDAQLKNSVAEVSNAAFKDIAYYSFEVSDYRNYQKNGSLNLGGTPGDARTGTQYLKIDNIGLTFSGLSATETYTISFWARSATGSILIDGIGTVPVNSGTVWKLFEYNVTNLTSLTVKRAGTVEVQLDDVRFYPSSGRMTTYTYDQNYGITSQTDANNQTIFTEYDAFGRVQTIRDENKNILKTFTINFKK